MGLRQKTSLKRCQNSEREELKGKSSPRTSKKTRPSRSNISLVRSDKKLSQFLDPSCDFETPISTATHAAPSSPSRVEAAVGTLGKLESEVIAALFPPSGASPATMEEISEDLGMSVEEVRNIADDALRGLRGLRSGPERVSKAWN